MMSAKSLLILTGFALAYLLAREWETRPIVHPPGVLAPLPPIQVNMPPSTFQFDEYLVTRRARVELRALVLSKEGYRLRREADLSPIDLALGWGPMSDQAVLDRIKITQSGRWYQTRYEYPAPIPDHQIISNSSNMHMIPAAKSVARQLKELREGDLVNLSGYLVDVDHESGWAWRTSLSRSDTGAGACEIVFVESVIVE
jgi:hypothetical protein